MKKCVLIAMTLAGIGRGSDLRDTKVDFVKDIQPLFQQSCIKCHGPEKQKGDLRLDSKAMAMKGGKDGVAITAGQADKSDLYRRITLPAGSDDIMPSKGDPLTKAQTDLNPRLDQPGRGLAGWSSGQGDRGNSRHAFGLCWPDSHQAIVR